MAYLLNSIGQFNFISLEGEYDPEAQTLVIDSRPGVDGMEFTLLGNKGQVFQMISLVDSNTIASAKQLVIDYKTLIAGNTVGVFKNSQVHFQCKVLNVTPIRIAKVANAVGNKQSAVAGVIVECRWDLIAVP